MPVSVGLFKHRICQVNCGGRKWRWVLSCNGKDIMRGTEQLTPVMAKLDFEVFKESIGIKLGD